MIDRDVFFAVLELALSKGGDFAEIFYEDKDTCSMRMIDGKLDNAITGIDHGAGIRVINNLRSVYVYTNETSAQGLKDCALKAAAAVDALKSVDAAQIVEKYHANINPIKIVPSSISSIKKSDIVRRAYNAARVYSKDIVQVSASYVDVDQRVYIANSEGLMTQDRRIRTRIAINSVASSDGQSQTGFEGPGRSCGFEFFDDIDVEHYAREASRCAVTALHAKLCPPGRMPVVINSGFGGVIFHEACGHSLEATSVAKGNSEFADKMGKKIASDVVTAYDDGTIPNEWGSFNIDDEGFSSARNLLIENGILKGFMVDRLNGKRMGAKPTGNSRRQSYRYMPTSRMTNTFIQEGEHEFEDIIKAVPYGLFAKKMGGGSVNPATGEFNFAVAEGYMIENGSISYPVRGATLVGKGSEILMKIDMVGKKLEVGQGMCGSVSGSVPAGVGQPVVRVSEMTVGGRE